MVRRVWPCKGVRAFEVVGVDMCRYGCGHVKACVDVVM